MSKQIEKIKAKIPQKQEISINFKGYLECRNKHFTIVHRLHTIFKYTVKILTF